MSYILEALKKAQAERQLGNSPTIHATVVHAPPVAGRDRKAVVLATAAGAVLVAGALVFWRQQGPATAAPAMAPAQQAVQPMASVTRQAETPVPAGPVTAVPTQLEPAAPIAVPTVPATAPKVALLPEPVDKPQPAAATLRPSKPALPVKNDPVPGQAIPVASARAPATSAAAAPTVVASAAPEAARPAQPAVEAPRAPAAAEDNVRGFNELPDAVRGQVPKVAFGGYMYSPNPADRLVLVDKTLRHEGEEVAPGLLLEKLLPKGAVMNYRGYRYRVGF
jgi:general secretion pathway protein B